MKYNQLNMFAGGEDLPLFSGAAAKAEESQYNPKEEPRQLGLFHCPICKDTGQVRIMTGGSLINCVCGQLVQDEGE